MLETRDLSKGGPPALAVTSPEPWTEKGCSRKVCQESWRSLCESNRRLQRTELFRDWEQPVKAEKHLEVGIGEDLRVNPVGHLL